MGLRYALDIETTCAVTSCGGIKYDKKGNKKDICDHGLDPFRCHVTHIGVWCPISSRVFHSVDEFKEWNDSKNEYITFGGKFDFKILHARGCDIISQWVADVNLMAVTHPKKIPDKWLAQYDIKRAERNRGVDIRYKQRKAGKHSLKTLAPFHLKIKPFWEDLGHQNDEYVLKDCEYTYKLYDKFKSLLGKHYTFYEKYLFPWVRDVLLPAEIAGVPISLDEIDKLSGDHTKKTQVAKSKLDEFWQLEYGAYYQEQLDLIKDEIGAMQDRAWSRLLDKNKTEKKWEDVVERHQKKYCQKVQKIESFNLDSPSQLLWLLKRRGYDVSDILDDSDEGTGVEILERLANEGKEDVACLIEYRKSRKLTTSFFPSYKEMQWDERLYPTFNPDIARTGRLSCSSPNLQQVSGDIKSLFRARPGRKLVTRDASGIEARLIAYYTCDPILTHVVHNSDFHGHNAKLYFNLPCDAKEVKKLYPEHRAVSKNIGFALFYGAGWRRLKKVFLHAGFDFSDAELKNILYRFREEYETALAFKKDVVDRELKKGKIITNLLGRPIYFDNAEDVYMKGFNTLIQSAASDLVLEGARRAQLEFDRLGLDARVIILVHDEIVVDVLDADAPRVAEILHQSMTSFNLTNAAGCIKLDTEGTISDVWAK